MIFKYKTTQTLEKKTRLEYAWDTGEKQYSETCVFDNDIDVKNYVKSCIQTVLLMRYQKFLIDVKTRHVETRHALSPQQEKDKQWQINHDTAVRASHYFANSQLPAIKKYILQLEPKLQTLLPKLTHPNEWLLKKELGEIIDFVTRL